MPDIHHAFTWCVDSGVLHLQKIHGASSSRVSRAVFTGLAIASGAIVVGLLVWCVVTLRDPAKSPADVLLIVLVVVVVLVVFSPSVLFVVEAGKPHRIALGESGLTVVSLVSRRHYRLEDVRALVGRRYRTNSRVPGGGSRLEAHLESGRHTLLVESTHSDEVADFEPIIRFFEQLKGDPRPRRTRRSDGGA